MSDAVTTAAVEGAAGGEAATGTISDADLDAALAQQFPKEAASGASGADDDFTREMAAALGDDPPEGGPAKKEKVEAKAPTEEPAPDPEAAAKERAAEKAARKKAIGELLSRQSEALAQRTQAAKDKVASAKERARIAEETRQAEAQKSKSSEDSALTKGVAEAVRKRDLVAAAKLLGVEPGALFRDMTAKALGKETPEGKLDEALSPMREALEAERAERLRLQKEIDETKAWRKQQEEERAATKKAAEEAQQKAQRDASQKEAVASFLHTLGSDDRYDELRDYFDDANLVEWGGAVNAALAAEGKPARSYKDILDRMLTQQQERATNAAKRAAARAAKAAGQQQAGSSGKQGAGAKPTGISADMTGQQGASGHGNKSAVQAERDFEADLARLMTG
ncbi:MAG: hypothetical protein M3Q61_04610 [Chloroflexota bacterium]|nr:hypothetical protein [Chloroflexota bacterium]